MADGLPHDERTFMAGHEAAAAANASALNRTAALGGNGTAAYEEPDPEEIQHAVMAFYLVVSWSWACGLLSVKIGRLTGRSRSAVPPSTQPPPPLSRRCCWQTCSTRPNFPPMPQLFVMFFAQAALVRWRKQHKRRCG